MYWLLSGRPPSLSDNAHPPPQRMARQPGQTCRSIKILPPSLPRQPLHLFDNSEKPGLSVQCRPVLRKKPLRTGLQIHVHRRASKKQPQTKCLLQGLPLPNCRERHPRSSSGIPQKTASLPTSRFETPPVTTSRVSQTAGRPLQPRRAGACFIMDEKAKAKTQARARTLLTDARSSKDVKKLVARPLQKGNGHATRNK